VSGPAPASSTQPAASRVGGDTSDPGRDPDLVTEAGQTADRVAAAALGVPGVDSLHGGAFGDAATYLPGRRVSGVRLTDQATEVHVVLRLDAPVLLTADRVRAAVAPLVDGRVDVVVEDVVDDGDVPDDVTPPSGGA